MQQLSMRSRQPYILKLFFTFQTPLHLYMLTEFCENGDLSNHLDALQLLDENLSKFLAAELILSMQHLHDQGIIYRDLKPENVLIDLDGHVRLADFGLAKSNTAPEDQSPQKS